MTFLIQLKKGFSIYIFFFSFDKGTLLNKRTMYKALYPFKSSDANALTFNAGDTFTLIDNKKDAHWWLVQNGKGEVGFVPENYLQQDQVSSFAIIFIKAQ